jgi:hypothetical protein
LAGNRARYVRELARQEGPLTESDVRNLHRLIMQRSAPDMAGQYAHLPRYAGHGFRRASLWSTFIRSMTATDARRGFS